MLSELTGWPPTVLDEQPQNSLDMIVIFKSVMNVAKNGGEYNG